ncbi:MAG: hypothetical protein IPJ84_14755 [Bdellovibrionales bacterium]|nr:hypothetical protein [Bdellovibrionales bacterium]
MLDTKILKSQLIFIAILAGATFSVFSLLRAGYSAVLVVNFVALTIFVFVLFLEKIMPFKKTGTKKTLKP